MISLTKTLRKYTQKNRAHFFFSLIEKMNRPINIIDLGGTATFWASWGLSETDHIHVTLINNHHVDKTNIGYDNSIPYITEIIKDVNELAVEDFQGYDLIFSNSMIEHLDSRQKQSNLAQTIEKSKRPYFIQVPNKYFIIDPHFPHPCVPFFALYPKNLQARLLTVYRFGSGSKSNSFEEAQRRLKFYNPLSLKELKKLFPSSEIIKKESHLFSISLIAIKGGVYHLLHGNNH
ncbi:hypothetical protein [Desulfobacter postgatei]|uniref:Methyltransferase family protein n=1 Tax=Desulfobacter postgatei 2ac9 TaxID=879212 RepID=I5B6K6_9BACT|nr:hypothetical protein [Desulfobacter postgatei]EIM65119.1 hypothetical protein DespoDRAFT_03346 [Desulfobacter postgatei 2ac9]